MKYLNTFAALILACSYSVLTDVQAAGRIGEQEYLSHCAVCHGRSATGNGPMVDFLKQAPSDLTQIRKRSGGRFPVQKVYDSIVDIGGVRAHGQRDMPIWGERYNRRLIEQEGEFGASTGDISRTQARVLQLVFYLATIQE